jgi:hypothetical protein
MNENERKTAALDLIRGNIEKHGFHIYVVSQRIAPRFSYTIGLSRLVDAELVLAGAIYYMGDDVVVIINEIADMLRREPGRRSFSVRDLGCFSLQPVDESWKSILMLGALDYYQDRSMAAWEVVPDANHWTNDVPDLTRPWSQESEPVWQWLRVSWPHAVPENSSAVTDLGALRGKSIRNAARWEEDQWEMFSSDEPEKSEVRIVPLATMLALDKTLLPVVGLEVEEGIIRDNAEDAWQAWR